MELKKQIVLSSKRQHGVIREVNIIKDKNNEFHISSNTAVGFQGDLNIDLGGFIKIYAKRDSGDTVEVSTGYNGDIREDFYRNKLLQMLAAIKNASESQRVDVLVINYKKENQPGSKATLLDAIYAAVVVKVLVDEKHLYTGVLELGHITDDPGELAKEVNPELAKALKATILADAPGASLSGLRETLGVDDEVFQRDVTSCVITKMVHNLELAVDYLRMMLSLNKTKVLDYNRIPESEAMTVGVLSIPTIPAMEMGLQCTEITTLYLRRFVSLMTEYYHEATQDIYSDCKTITRGARNNKGEVSSLMLLRSTVYVMKDIIAAELLRKIIERADQMADKIENFLLDHEVMYMTSFYGVKCPPDVVIPVIMMSKYKTDSHAHTLYKSIVNYVEALGITDKDIMDDVHVDNVMKYIMVR